MSEAPSQPRPDWAFMRRDGLRARPGGFTLREVLLALSLGTDTAQAYVETAFGWYFDRTRAFIFGALAGAIGSATLVFDDGDFGSGPGVVIGSLLVVGLLVAAAY